MSALHSSRLDILIRKMAAEVETITDPKERAQYFVAGLAGRVLVHDAELGAILRSVYLGTVSPANREAA